MIGRIVNMLCLRYGVPVTPSGIICMSKSPTLVRRPMQCILWYAKLYALSCFVMLQPRS